MSFVFGINPHTTTKHVQNKIFLFNKISLLDTTKTETLKIRCVSLTANLDTFSLQAEVQHILAGLVSEKWSLLVK